MEQHANLFELQLDQQALSALNETARWNKFISIVWFVLCGLMAVGAVLFGMFFAAIMSSSNTLRAPEADSLELKAASSIGGIFFTIMYLVFTAIQFIPTLFRYRFSVKMIKAIRHNDQLLLNESLNQFRYYSRYWGIVTIIISSIYALMFVFMLIGLALGAAAGSWR